MTRSAAPEHYGRARLKRALLHFLTGRLLSGGLGIVSLVLIVRHLPAEQFGLYAAMLSLQVVFLAYSSFGIEPAMERYLPELRLRAGGAEVLRFVGTAIAIRLAFLLLAILSLRLVVPWIAQWLGITDVGRLLDAYVWVILAVALMNIAGVALEAMLEQKTAQISAVVYAGVRFALILSGILAGSLDIAAVVRLDLYGALAAFGLSVIALIRLGLIDDGSVHPDGGRVPAGERTIWGRFRLFAIKNFLAQMIMQTYGPHALRLAVTSLAGLLETARLGFAMSMSELVQRYLPATLLMRMIRPVFVSRYVERRDFGQLNAFANLVLKLNVLVLAPLLGFVAACGNEASAIVSAGRYTDVGWILFGVVLLLFPTSHQIVVSILANTLEENDIQIKSALVGLSGVLIAWMLIPSYGAYGALIASIASAVAYNSTSALLLRQRGYAYRVDSKGLARLFGAAAAGAIPAWALARGVDGLFGLILAGASLLVVYVAVASRYRAFSADERDMINRLLPKPVFFF
ncbi:lipopolysaccharide biosynthesis protein [Methyloversatilis discipulorum]|uniref:lipopolysaccharide biosynthesis protein n=1 Tax=Methyloversatilis discipulorum TaxID=1119528 RepID=UPI001A39BC51|nr:hypothetical protein [Methyloversatilis discipulorum]MBL8469178.1 oligosaccharide flippase family protein [Methyloversatilis discipulorum]